jgi:CRISPR-associated protein Csd1
MIVQALNRYYEILRESGMDIARFGYTKEKVSFALNISSTGELLDILPMFDQEQRGKKVREVPRLMIVPEYAEPTSNVQASFLCGKCDYVLGISKRDGDKPEHSAARYEEFRRFNSQLLRQVDTDAGRAVIAFLETHDRLQAYEHPGISLYLKEILKGGRIVFLYRGAFVHEDPLIQQVWEEYHASKDLSTGQCLVTGEQAAVTIKHRKIHGNVGKNSFDSPLISFNQRAFESYNRAQEQGMNSPIGDKAAFAYSTALNYLLSNDNPNRKFYLGDAVIVYWAETTRRPYESVFASVFDSSFENALSIQHEERRRAESTLQSVADKVTRVRPLDLGALLPSLGDENPRFYVLGLAPVGDGRLCVRIFINDLFENIVENIMTHYKDLEIAKEYDEQPTYLSVSQILYETVSKKVRDKDAAPLLSGAVTRAVLTNSPYPSALYNAILNRVHSEMDDKEGGIKKINYVRAAVIKAFLIRKYRHVYNPFKEVLTMALNEQSTIPAYLLGRLFAVLEKVQIEAAKPTVLNATIKDRYFTSACASPQTVFPTLLRLSQHHIAKAEYGKSIDRDIQDILNLLDVEKNPIPSRLTLDEQGIFVLGYYHQRAVLYTKRNDAPSEANQSK